MKYLGLIWSNLKRKKLRTILTVLSILVAFVLFGYLAALRMAFNQGVEVVGLDRLVVRHKVSIIQLLPESYEIKMERIQGVEDATFATWFGGNYKDPRNFFAKMPVKHEEFLEMFPEYLLTDEERRAWLDTRTGAIVGRATADRFGWKVGDRIPIEPDIWRLKDSEGAWEFDLVGIYDGAEKGTDTTSFFFRQDYFHESRRYGEGQVGWYWVKISEPERASEIAALIDQEFANSPAETKTEPEGAFAQGFANQAGNVGFILTAILGAVFFTILLVVGNTMAQAVRERTRELGTLKALGFTHRAVSALVLAESLVIALLGGLAGLGLAWIQITAGGDPSGGMLPFFYFAPRDLLIGVALALMLGVVAGLWPASQAQRLQIAEAMRR